MFGGGSCIAPEPEADGIEIEQLPPEVIFPQSTYGWLMYPGSGACNNDKAQDDASRQELALSLDQGKYGWRQDYGQTFPYPVSFRLFQQELTPASDPLSRNTVSFSDVGKNRNIASAPPVLDYEFARPQFENDPNSDIAREYARRDWRIYYPDAVIDRLQRPSRGNNPYPQPYYPVFTPEELANPPPAQLFRPINVLARLADDLATGELEQAALDPVELANFAGAFMGPPISENPVRYNWPDQLLIAQLRRLQGFVVPVDSSNAESAGTRNYYSANGHTLEEALAIAQVYAGAVNSWLETQDYSVMANLGLETPAQREAERWLYRQEDLWVSPEETIDALDRLDVARELNQEDVGDLANIEVEAIQRSRQQEALINADSFEAEGQPLSQLGVSVGGNQGQLAADQNQFTSQILDEIERPATEMTQSQQVQMTESQQQPGVVVDTTVEQRLNAQSMQDPELSNDLGQATNPLYQSLNPNAGGLMGYGMNFGQNLVPGLNQPITELPSNQILNNYWALRRGRGAGDQSFASQLSRQNSRSPVPGGRTERARSRSPGPG
ncbi:hypothetical protein ABW21_db0207040 [Orbilia brochopaga]|nr:hypothetical protein ABW21_db0207040 [Drechslerella brochopaga]